MKDSPYFVPIAWFAFICWLALICFWPYAVFLPLLIGGIAEAFWPYSLRKKTVDKP